MAAFLLVSSGSGPQFLSVQTVVGFNIVSGWVKRVIVTSLSDRGDCCSFVFFVSFLLFVF